MASIYRPAGSVERVPSASGASPRVTVALAASKKVAMLPSRSLRYRAALLVLSFTLPVLGIQAQERQDAGMEAPHIPPPDASAAEVPPSYRVEVAVKDLTYPTSVEFDAAGNMYVAEGGYISPPAPEPRVGGAE